MQIAISTTANELGLSAATLAAEKLREAIASKGEATLVVSTGSSQFETLSALIKMPLDWSRITVFHLDEYIGLEMTHPASFRKYLYERFINQIPAKAFFPVDGSGDPKAAIQALTDEIRKRIVDVGLIGIGENGHIAFNDPPADFETKEAYLVVDLDERCKLQQVNEGWFATLEDVPKQAISMSVWQIMQCRTIISAVPHAVKADAIAMTMKNSETNLVPATKLKSHSDWYLFLDKNSASKFVVL